MIKTAIILCAGYGKRLNPVTLKIPKPLIKLKNKPLLSNAIDPVSYTHLTLPTTPYV